MKVVITGSTGMIGKGVLLECLEDPLITEIILVNRTPIEMTHSKIKELICSDWFDLSNFENDFKGLGACFFCLGISAVGLAEDKFKKITYDLTLNFAQTLSRLNRDLIFCYVSGMGIDAPKSSKTKWAIIKGKTEADLLKLPFKGAFMFRPGYVHPLKGVQSKTALYRLLYFLLRPFYFIFKHFMKRYITSSINIGKAMIYVSQHGYKQFNLENNDINQISKL